MFVKIEHGLGVPDMRQFILDCISCDPVRKNSLIVAWECGRKLDSCTHIPGTSRYYFDKDGLCIAYRASDYIDNTTEEVIKEGKE